MIVDEFTGRTLAGRRWSEGLHQAIEAKEGVRIREENQTVASVTFQNFFRMYEKLSGMTGTADTEAGEFHKIYKLDVVVIPTNRAMVRIDDHDLVYRTEREKFEAVVEEIVGKHEKGQPSSSGRSRSRSPAPDRNSRLGVHRWVLATDGVVVSKRLAGPAPRRGLARRRHHVRPHDPLHRLEGPCAAIAGDRPPAFPRHGPDDPSSATSLGPARFVAHVAAKETHTVDLLTGVATRIADGFGGIERPLVTPDGRWLFAGTWHGEPARVIDTASGRTAPTINRASVRGSFSPDGRRLAVGIPGLFRIYPVGDWRTPITVEGSGNEVALPSGSGC